MNPTRSRIHLLTAVVVALAFALPSLAVSTASRRRASGPPPTVPKALDSTILGHLADAGNGMPVANAQIIVENNALTASNKNGDFTLKTTNGRAFTIVAQRSGYQTATKDVVGMTGTQNVTLTMTATSTLTLKDLDGNTHVIDYDSVLFGYLVTFSGYQTSSLPNFCATDGSAYMPDKNLLSKIIGPAVPVSNAGCCTLGPIMQITIVTKPVATGDSPSAPTTVYFADSCFGNEVDFIGRDHVSGEFTYYDFTKVAEIDFP